MTGRYVNQTELRIVGMSRSGNHAIINWIMAQLPGRFCFLNCAEPKFNPFESARTLMHGRPYIANYDTFDIEAERRGDFSRKDYLLHSYEDCFLGLLNNRRFAQAHDRWVGASRQRIDVLILRDPFNLFASRRKAGIGGVTTRIGQRIWKQHAREFLGLRRYLNDPLVAINYNAWTGNPAYRRDLAARLGLAFTDAGAHATPVFAPGSAFDAPDDADRRRLLQRWRHYAEDSDYRELFDGEMVGLARRLFELPPELVRELADNTDSVYPA
ncbi:hypothetical protein [Salinisphaera sp.]|uniref:hypothetical protein n=1 Tax=Salinisphaera sp. TaxID=1914330 RepID=UPI002D76B09D|nr:hypothetical protein [Salinisphaera sp.]HET7313646.1 hypothetical protein [Salinisphaera sp.]